MGFFHRLRERFWFIPALLCLGALVLARAVPAQNVDDRLRSAVAPLRCTLAGHVGLLRDSFVSAGHHPHGVRELGRQADDVLAELGTADRTHPSEGHPA